MEYVIIGMEKMVTYYILNMNACLLGLGCLGLWEGNLGVSRMWLRGAEYKWKADTINLLGKLFFANLNLVVGQI